MNGGMKQWVGQWPKREELLWNSFREEIGLPVTDAGTESGCETGSPSYRKNTDWQWGERLRNDFECKMFWKEVKRVRKGEQARDEMVKDVNGQILLDGVEVRRRWAEYFEQVLNADVWEANINVVGNWRMPVLGGWWRRMRKGRGTQNK